eukprot:14498008-Heterocapsa_arctica.AAC.1
MNFWVYVTIFEEKETRGGKVQKLGYKFYRDWGNETYADYLNNTAMKARKKHIIDKEELAMIMKVNINNLGNILEAIMGYAWLS